MKFVIPVKKAVVCGALLVCATALWSGACDKGAPLRSGSEVGSVAAELTFPSGAMVTAVHYVLKGTSAAGTPLNIKGDIPLTAPGSTASVGLGAPVGTGYTVMLTATTTDGRMCSGMSDPFSVDGNQVSKVTVLINCATSAGLADAGIAVTGVLDNCPSIVAAAASSLIVMSGGTLELSATASDIDPQDAVTYSWSAGAGTFDKTDTATTKFHCPAAAGLVTITLDVVDHNGMPGAAGGSDGSGQAGGAGGGSPSATPANIPTGPAKCKTSAQVVVNCGLCGNGALDESANETCDPPNGRTCDSVCQTIVGAGGAAGGSGAAVGGHGGGAGGGGGAAGVGS